MSETDTLAFDKSASVLGIHEFSLCSRIQTGDITAARLRFGEIVIPISELERLLHRPVNVSAISGQNIYLSSDGLGIKRITAKTPKYAVPDCVMRFGETEIKGYRVAFGAIANELKSVSALKRQLDKSVIALSEREISNPQIGVWWVRSTLLNLSQSRILLCQQQNELAVIEKFRADSPYAMANDNVEILLQDDNAERLEADFKAGAHHTLEFMASNLMGKAQTIVGKQFYDRHAWRILAAISKRCRQAVQPNGRGMRI